LQGLRTRAVRDGDSYLINGSKIFITNGFLAGLIALVVKTEPGAGPRHIDHHVETENLKGFRVGRISTRWYEVAGQRPSYFFGRRARFRRQSAWRDRGPGF